MSVAHIVIAIIVIPIISGLIKGWSSTCKRTNYLTSMEMTRSRFDFFNSEYETNAEVSLNQANIFGHDVSSPEIEQKESENTNPITFTASEIPEEMNGSLNELFKALSAAEELSTETIMDKKSILNKDQSGGLETQVEPVVNVEPNTPDVSGLSDELYYCDQEEPEMNYDHQVDALPDESFIVPHVEESNHLIPPSEPERELFQGEETIDEMVESFETKRLLSYNVIPFPCDLEHLDVPSVISESDFKAIQRRYGPVIANSITTTPQLGGGSSPIDVMIGRIGFLEMDRVLQYGGHQVIIKGKGVSELYEGQAVLIKGQFVKNSIFMVSMIEDLEQIQDLQKSNMG